MCQVLFIFQGVGRIHPGGPVGVIGGDRYSHDYGNECGNQEQVPLDINVPAEILQPPVDSKPGNGPADQVGDHNQQEKLF